MHLVLTPARLLWGDRRMRTKRNPTGPNLDRFAAWLARKNSAETTIAVYRADVRQLLRDGDPVAVLLDPARAPLTRRRMLSALRAWARFTENAKLLLELGELKLPPRERRSVKQPLVELDYRALRDELEKADYLDEPVRLVLSMLTLRGFRAGDVLRITRDDITRALKDGTIRFVSKGGRLLSYSIAQYRSHLKALGDQSGEWQRVDELIAPRAKNTRRAAWQRLDRALQAVGRRLGWAKKDLHSHRLRRTYAVRFLKAMDGDPQALQKLQAQMGWKNRDTLFEYTDFVRGEELAAVERKMDR